jgi:putative redox protein
MDATVTWKQGLSFDCTASTGFTLPLGASPAVGGDNDGFRPMELILSGLIGCTAMDVISILQKKRQNITEFRVFGHATRAEEHPKVFTKITLEYQITGKGIDEEAVRRAIELSETKYCPAQAMLSQVVSISHIYSVQEDDES